MPRGCSCPSRPRSKIASLVLPTKLPAHLSTNSTPWRSMSNDLLDFLTDGLHGKQRDAVTQAFYEYASGDPKSAPVGMAVLLTACARRMSQAPEELRAASVDFKKLLAEGREMEARIRERVELSNAGVIAEFRDETRRASSALRETFQYAKDAGESAKKTAQEL